VAEFAADLYHNGFGRLLVCSGAIAHQGDLLATPWDRTEAEMYAEVVIARGVPPDWILLEPRTAENIRFSRELLEARAIRPRNIVLAMKPLCNAGHGPAWQWNGPRCRRPLLHPA
jgi:uncharacterized SAM-binding protein YcdF (DUF218 family)